jgi:hypothetical protein
MSTDKQDVIECYARYCRYNDTGRDQAFVDLFTEDCVFEITGAIRIVGRDALLKWRLEDLKMPAGKHVTVNHIVDIDGDRAHAVADFFFLAADSNLVTLSMGTYTTDLVRRDGAWLIERNEIAVDGSRKD